MSDIHGGAREDALPDGPTGTPLYANAYLTLRDRIIFAITDPSVSWGYISDDPDADPGPMMTTRDAILEALGMTLDEVFGEVNRMRAEAATTRAAAAQARTESSSASETAEAREDNTVSGERDNPDAVKSVANLLVAVEMQNDTIRKLADSIRILNNRVERLERDPTRNIA